MRKSDKYIPITNAKARFSELIRQVEKEDNTIAITKDGVPTAVIISMERFEGLLETLDILSDEKTIRSLRKSISQARKGEWINYDKVFGR